ncbi:TrmH family RNA methyltransferase [Mariniradius sediminis]|uniref:RNA methyltransferase n=1 Tax=Mariniradius sediminis TaxID=2909237 RepID=A0ABS9BXA4_9BACT|nr:RNA methyltransferase [Mariniradius sediminis]MCF1752694.1 RNA methyltransferase [Mariniradius sediminis]
MLSKNTLKFIKSLQQKKFRIEEQSFFVEGAKSVLELLGSDFEVTHLLYTDRFLDHHPKALYGFKGDAYSVTEKTLEMAGSLQTNDAALAVARMKENVPFSLRQNEWVLALDDVRDPGNLGTIIRIADWYGIKKVVMSLETADLYNPKVLQASMGSFTRIRFFYTDLEAFLPQSKLPLFGAFLDGESVYTSRFPNGGILVMGNESKGISSRLEKCIQHKVTIPRFGNAESLNVAVATAVICDNILRQITTNSKKV